MDVEKFINLVQNYKCLWDQNDSSYHLRNLQRKAWKQISEEMKISRAGDFWFEEGEIGKCNTLGYKLISTALFFVFVFMTILEIIAATVGDLPEDEKSDCVTFAVSHTIVMTKIFSVMGKRHQVKELNSKLIEICKDREDEDRLAENYRIMRMNVVAYLVSVYGSVAGFIMEGLRKMMTGSHFITIVTYWPYFEDDSITAVSCRFFTTAVFCLLMAAMISIDSFAMVTLIMYKYKFVTLRLYLEGLRAQFDRNNYAGNEVYATDQLQAGLVEGIIMHANLIRLSKDIDQCFGKVMALQVFQSSGAAVSLLLQFAVSKNLTIGAGMKIFFFLVAIFFLLALFLCNAGEITYQASLLSNSYFYCGWHLSRKRSDLRQLVLMACASAQRPLVIKAFKMLDLTYSTFLQVIRGTYSVFALFYAHNE